MPICLVCAWIIHVQSWDSSTDTGGNACFKSLFLVLVLQGTELDLFLCHTCNVLLPKSIATNHTLGGNRWTDETTTLKWPSKNASDLQHNYLDYHAHERCVCGVNFAKFECARWRVVVLFFVDVTCCSVAKTINMKRIAVCNATTYSARTREQTGQ